MKIPARILPLIVLAQFCCTSLWFAGNGVMADLLRTFQLESTALSHLTSAVQFGFIAGTLVFAILSIADRFSPSRVFFVCAILGAVANAGTIWEGNSFASLLSCRFFTGFFLAGIYPVGMKIAADYFDKGLGKSLGFLVGALVVGTAFPHLLKGIPGALPWQAVLLATSGLAILGGFCMLVGVPNGPFRRAGAGIRLSAFMRVFREAPFRRAAFGYFGHMWELYAFWAFTPFLLDSYQEMHPLAHFNIPLLSFGIIGIGGIACVLGGFIAARRGTATTASWMLGLSGLCCLVSPLLFWVDIPWLFVGFLFFWGMVVVADSPLFSTLVAQNAPSELKGTALTIVNCIGFSVTIVSIQLLNWLAGAYHAYWLMGLLAIGPAIGLIAVLSGKNRQTPI